MYSAIGAAVAAQHVKEMLDQAAQDHQAAAVRRARRARSARRAGRHDGTVLANPVLANPVPTASWAARTPC